MYNALLNCRCKRWQESRHSVTYQPQVAMWRDWRDEKPDENPLSMFKVTTRQQVMRRPDAAFRAFFQGKWDYPLFKQTACLNSISYTPGDSSRISRRALYGQKVGLIPVRRRRQLSDGILRNLLLLRRPFGLYVRLQIALPEPEMEPHVGLTIAIDMRLKHASAFNDGTTDDSLQQLLQSLAKLRRWQRKVARRKKGRHRCRKGGAPSPRS